MRICLDVQAAVGQSAGVGRYARMLAQHLGSALTAEDELVLFYFDFHRRGFPIETPRAAQHAVRWCPGRLIQQSWKSLNGPAFDRFVKADVYHFPNFIIPPLRAGRSVVTVHDLSFIRFPDFADDRNRRYLTARIQDTVRRADAVIADSLYGATEVQTLLGVPADRVFAVPLGISDRFKAPTPDERKAVLRRLGLDRPYLLTVGTLEPRKNVPFLVDLYEKLSGFDGDLVIAGAPGWKYQPILDRIRASRRSTNIRYLDYVGDADLPALYAGARLFLLASFYEGFGFPPLEAMACGTPVISSSGGSLPEILGDAALFPGDFEPDRWVASIQRLFSDTELQRSLVERGTRRASAYSWGETARRTGRVYAKAAGLT